MYLSIFHITTCSHFHIPKKITQHRQSQKSQRFLTCFAWCLTCFFLMNWVTSASHAKHCMQVCFQTTLLLLSECRAFYGHWRCRDAQRCCQTEGFASTPACAGDLLTFGSSKVASRLFQRSFVSTLKDRLCRCDMKECVTLDAARNYSTMKQETSSVRFAVFSAPVITQQSFSMHKEACVFIASNVFNILMNLR